MGSLTKPQQRIAHAQIPCLSSHNVLTLNVGGYTYEATAASLLCPAAAGSKLAETAKLHCQAHGQHTSENSAFLVADSCPENSQEDHADVDKAEGSPGSCRKGTPDGANYPATAAATAIADFSNRDGVLFAYVIDYLAAEVHLAPPNDISTCQQLLKEAEYYCLPGLVDLLKEHMVALSKADAGDACRAKQEKSNAHQKLWKLQKVEQGMLELRQLQQRLHKQLRQQRTKQQQMYSQLQQQRNLVAEVKQDISYLRSAVA